jgi:hypothetical protein
VSLSDHTETSEVGEAELKPTHDVPNYLVVALCDNESLGATLVHFHEEIRAIVFWKTDPVDLDNCREIVRSKRAQKIGRFQQSASALTENF